MAWEQRSNGRTYFYLSRRLPDGRVRKKYFGKGHSAEVEATRLEFKAFFRQQENQQYQRLRELEALSKECMTSIQTLFEAQLYAAGFHNPKSRGWRRRTSMIKQVEKQNDSENTTSTTVDADGGEMDLKELIQRCRENDPQAIKTLRNAFVENPRFLSTYGHVFAKAQTAWIQAICGSDGFDREMMLKTTKDLRTGLRNEGSGTYLEGLMVEQVITSYLEQGFHQLLQAKSCSAGIPLSKHHAEAQEHASRRHTKSLNALSTLRKLSPQIAPQENSVVDHVQTTETPKNQQNLTFIEKNRLKRAFEQSGYQIPMN